MVLGAILWFSLIIVANPEKEGLKPYGEEESLTAKEDSDALFYDFFFGGRIPMLGTKSLGEINGVAGLISIIPLLLGPIIGAIALAMVAV